MHLNFEYDDDNGLDKDVFQVEITTGIMLTLPVLVIVVNFVSIINYRYSKQIRHLGVSGCCVCYCAGTCSPLKRSFIP